MKTVILHKFVKLGRRCQVGVMGNLGFWYLIPTIEVLTEIPELQVDVYIRFLCFSIDFFILTKKH